MKIEKRDFHTGRSSSGGTQFFRAVDFDENVCPRIGDIEGSTRMRWKRTGLSSSGGTQFFLAAARALSSASRASRSVGGASEGVRRT